MAKIIAEWVHPVEWGKAREFARAVHDDHAEAETAPPTFPVVMSADFIEKLVTEILDLDRKRTVHGEQEYEYRRPLRVGEMVRCRASILDDQVKQGRRGGAMRIVVSEVELSSEPGGEVIGYERSTSIETAPAAGGAT
jgi:hypothetical protein